MVTTAQEYYANLSLLQNVNQPAYAILPSAENIYNINMTDRTIEAPKFLSVEKDHKSETIYFSVDRYVDYMDLSQTCCVIHYKNAKKQSKYYAVPFYDIYTKANQGKILFPWCLDAHVTETPGWVEFSIRFFKIGEILNDKNEAEPVFTYNLNTRAASSTVLQGMQESQINTNDEYYLKPSQFEQLNQRIDDLFQSTQLNWTILNENDMRASLTPEAQQDLNDLNEVVESNKE